MFKTPSDNRVLIADDDPMMRHLLVAVVKQQQGAVVVASDGREAYRILQADAKFRAAIIDINMPFLEGLDLAQSFAERVFFLSPAVAFAPNALRLLEQYAWPRNIRELDWVSPSTVEGEYAARVRVVTSKAAARVLGVDCKTLDRMIKRHRVQIIRKTGD